MSSIISWILGGQEAPPPLVWSGTLYDVWRSRARCLYVATLTQHEGELTRHEFAERCSTERRGDGLTG